MTSAREVLAQIQPADVLEALRREHSNKARAARALGINRRSLYRLIEKYGISAPDAPDEPTIDTDSDVVE